MFARIAILIFSLVSLTGCASSAIEQSWVAEDASTVRLGKTLAFVMVPSATDRRNSEDLFVQTLQPAIDATAAHTVIDEMPFEAPAQDKITANARQLGFDSILVVRIVETRDQAVYRPGAGYMFSRHHFGLWGHHDFGFPLLDPGYYDTVRVMVVELSLYALDGQRLLWTGNAELFNPRDLTGSVKRLADGMIKDLVAKGLLP